MSKFPMLNLYRTLAIILAVIIIVVGILSAINAASLTASFNSFSRFDLGTFIIVLLPFLGGAFALGVVAELILLALRIEDHLDVMRSAQEGNIKTVKKEAPAPVSEAIQGTVSVEKTSIRPDPGARGSNGTLKIGQTVLIYGRNIDGQWVEIDNEGQNWVLMEHLDIQGDIKNLPVKSQSSMRDISLIDD